MGYAGTAMSKADDIGRMIKRGLSRVSHRIKSIGVFSKGTELRGRGKTHWAFRNLVMRDTVEDSLSYLLWEECWRVD